MIVYFVEAQEAYDDITGTQTKPELFGPWEDVKDAGVAVSYLQSLECQGYSKGSRMKQYEYVLVSSRVVLDHFETGQVY